MNEVTVKIDPERILGRYSLFFGVAALFVCFTSFQEGMYESFVLGVLAITLSALSKKGRSKTAAARAGMILGILSVAISSILYYGFISFYTLIKDPELAPKFLEALERSLGAYGVRLEDFLNMMHSTR